MSLKQQPRTRPWKSILLFIAPVMLYYGIFILYPVFATIYNSFHMIQPIAGSLKTTFVGLQNYKDLFSDHIFIMAVKNTLTWALVGPILELLVATTLAFVVFFKVPFFRFYRTVWFAPMLITGVIVGIIFKWIFNYDWGLLNAFLRALGLDNLAINWLGNKDTPLWVVIAVHFWNTFGYSFVLILGGLSSVDASLIESSVLDGAGKIRISLQVLLPIIFPVFVTTLLLSFMGKMRAFHVVWVLTKGGPMHYSETIATYVQKRAFGWGTLDLGYPSAISVFWFGIVLITVNFLNYYFNRRQERNG